MGWFLNEKHDQIAATVCLAAGSVHVLSQSVPRLHKPIPGPIEKHFLYLVLGDMVLHGQFIHEIR